MKKLKFFVAAMAFAAAATLAVAAEPGTMVPSATLFEYDNLQPLYPEVALREEKPTHKMHRVEYQSTNGMRVPAFYYVPTKGKRPLPCIIFTHGGGGSKDDFTSLYEFMAMRGFAILAPDAHLHGERVAPNIEPDQSDWYKTRNIILQTVVDLRRGVDWLETRPEIDADRIGYMGGSQGAFVGSVFVAVEKRVAAAAILVGGADFRVFLRHSLIPSLVLLRNYATEEEIDRYADILAVVDPMYYISAIAPRPLLLMNGTRDLIISKEAGERLQELAGEPKELHWYEGAHIPPIDKALLLASKFFKKHLKRKKPPAPAEPPAGAAEKPKISFSLERDFSNPENRVVTASASAEKPLPPGASLAIHFPRLSPRNLPMYDDGTHGDEKAGDGVWTMRLELGPRVPDLDVIGGDELYSAQIRALAAGGEVLSSADAGPITVEKQE